MVMMALVICQQSPKQAPHALDAADYIIQTCRAHSGEISLCPVGPLTNIAIALQRDPDLVNHVKSVVIMGGAILCRGMSLIMPKPISGMILMPLILSLTLVGGCQIGLDVTTQVMITRLNINLSQMPGRLANSSMIFLPLHSFMRPSIMMMFVLHDPCAVIALTDPHLFEYRKMPVHVICDGPAIGLTVPDASLPRHAAKIAIMLMWTL